MRKHFLLFFLMLLLPLGAWAEDISTASVAVGNIVKGTEHPGAPFVVWEGETLTGTGESAHYTVDENYYTRSGEPGSYTYTSVGSNLSTKPVGTYYLRIEGIPEHGFQGEAYGAFKITKRPLTIDFTAVAATYGDNPTAVAYTIYDGETALEGNSAIVTGLGIQAVTKSGANVIEITNTTAVGNYDFDFTYNETDDCDYTLTRKAEDNDKYVISAKSISAAGMTVEMGEAGTYNYTGNNITGLPTFTVTDGTTPVTTFNVQWFADEATVEAADNTAVNPKNADTYYARIVGSGNYTGKVVNNDTWKITVNRVPLTVLVNPKSKTYDGDDYTTDDVEYTFGGLVDADQGKVDLTTLSPKVDGDAWVDFKNYKENGYVISVDVTGAQIGTVALNTNYTVTPVSSTWTINKKEGLTISAANQQIDFNEEIPATSDITVAGAVNDTEKEAIEAYYTAPKANSAVNNAYGIQPEIYTPALVDGDHPYLANYADPAIVAGNLSVGAASATIMPIVASAIYDGEGHLATGYSATSGEYVLTADDIEGTPSYKYKMQNPETLAWGEWDENLVPTAVGVYRAAVKSTSVSGKGSFANAVFNKPEVQFQILAKPITVTVNNVTLHTGDTEATLKAHASVTDAYEAALISGESLEFDFTFDEDKVGAEKVVVVDVETGKISAGEAYNPEDTDNDAIVASLKEGVYNNNYDITFVPGDLIFGASELVLDPTDATLATKIAEAAATGEDYQITFANNATLNAKEWYAMVLPFKTTPVELVQKLGTYVVVNRLKSSSMENGKVDVNFSLEMEEIPAGEPFLIKAAKAMDWDVITITPQEGDDPEIDNSINVEAANLNGEVADVVTDFATYTGTYETGNSVKWGLELDGTTADANAKYRWLAHKEYKGDNNWKNPKTNPHNLIPMEAYLVLDAAAEKANIFVEDFDFENNTTAIKCISADEINGLNVKGMYNLNGMKMETAPTQKGVYIINGKKVVIK